MATLVLIPRSDRDFEAIARLLARPVDTPTSLQAKLRQHWPEASVWRSEVSGQSDVWYVYRDGHWLAP